MFLGAHLGWGLALGAESTGKTEMEGHTSFRGLSRARGRKQDILGLLPALPKVERQSSRERKKKDRGSEPSKKKTSAMRKMRSVGAGPPEPGCGPNSRENQRLGEPEPQPLGTCDMAVLGLLSGMSPWCALAWKHALPQPAQPRVPLLRCPDFCWTDLG